MSEDIVTGGRATCAYCGLEVEEVQDPWSFNLDYGRGGDFGCGADPWSDEEGTGGHLPVSEMGRLVILEGRELRRVIQRGLAAESANYRERVTI